MLAVLSLVAGLIAVPAQAHAADESANSTGYAAVIRRTSYGIPHITGSTLANVMFGQGWAYAEDRFCDLDDQVIKVRSQRSRWFGPGADGANIATDLGYREIDIMGLATAQLARLSTEESQVIEGYVAGYNGYLAKVGAANVPGWCAGAPWITPITDVDVLAYQRDVALLGSGQNFLAAMAAASPPGSAAPTVGGTLVEQGVRNALAQEAGDGALGSNGWALGSQKSTTGKGALVANPHFPWQGNLRFWESQLTVPNQFNVYGGSLGGVPGVQIGFTNNVAWTHTIAAGARYTFYSLNLVPGSPTRYLVDGVPEAMTSKTITIQVNYGSGPVNYTTTLYQSRYGPIIDLSSLDPGLGWSTASAMTYRDANIDNDRIMRQWLDIAKAGDVGGIRDAITRDQGIPWVNTIATDSAGHAWYADASQTPDLSPASIAEWESNPLGILDGSNSANAWVTAPGARSPGLIPFGAQPQLQRGDYVFNANDSHWLANTKQLLTGYSPLQGFEGMPQTVRTRQNVALLEGKFPGTVDSSGRFSLTGLGTAILSDTTFTSDQLASAVVTACRARGSTPVVVDGNSVNISPGCSALAAWDRTFDVGSGGAVLWRETIASVLDQYPDALTTAGPLWGVSFSPTDPGHTPRGAPADPMPLLQAMARAILRLRGLGYAPNVKLQTVQYTIKNNVRIPVPGAGESVGIANAVYFEDDTNTSLEPRMSGGTPLAGTDLTSAGYVVNFGTSFLATVQFAASGPQARGLLTFGESGSPSSPHYSDQTQLFKTKTLRPMLYTDSAINSDPNLTVEAILGLHLS
ncbi:penicillin acylase family protein [Rugosimonospora africana]|uniref:Aculeacin A acylase n=1 Tax=Rugosimonospora africana TaxID=556532 RepID=A0A8J3VV01_9ACTN|nr:penicillin acylase family protein [Rugosimonospora africana]GIH19286.1 aculeacin A acylase [Rugosimonospora africana]